MRILYGVVGEGMGHATRSKVMLTHLSRDHDLMIVASDRAHTYLRQHFPNVIEIEGFKLAFQQGAIDRSASFWDLVKHLPQMLLTNVTRFVELCKNFSPDVVISDFESFAYTFGITQGIPVISIDNMQIINRCKLDLDIPEDLKADFKLAKAIVKSKLPGCHHYMITSFFYPPIRKKRTSLFPPILRPEILKAVPEHKNHILVYQTTTSNESLLEQLKKIDSPFIVYGFQRREKMGHIALKEFSEIEFVQDLAACRAVLANGGFSLMGEAVYLHKPMLAVPVKKQFEQSLNALALEESGFGEYHSSTDVASIKRFISHSERYAANLQKVSQDGNHQIFKALDDLLESLAAGRSHFPDNNSLSTME